MSSSSPMNEVQAEKLLVRGCEAAAFLGLSRDSFNRKVKERELPPPIVLGAPGGHPRWRVRDLVKAKDNPAPILERMPRSVPLGPDVTHLYRHFNSAGELLYVGISLSAIARLADHKMESAWFWTIARIEVTAYPTRERALRAERVAIQRERPQHNVVHARKSA